ncbi:fimbrillin family protein [uncultured Bacteroides sp.]|uniref:fimbrillin family protein n=1 Tax=uncultured Bacteroides sp. TaxID=162156 RepID=UPI00262ADC83|nr:fimbrillin family protein [uncultured Bacteroides sp.]
MKKNVKLLGMVAMFSVALASCTNDELKEVYQGEEISFTTRMTRAVETNTGNLKAFKVYAHAEGYGNTMFIDGLLAEKVGTINTYSIVSETGGGIFWPSQVNKIQFWAYGPFQSKTEGVSVTPVINYNSQSLNDFAVKSSMTDGGKEHEDLIVAYREAVHGAQTGTNVSLDFKHALAQIVVKAKRTDKEKTVKIKGAWLMNVKSKGNLKFDKGATDNDNMLWTDISEVTNYGVQQTDGLPLLDESSFLIGMSKENAESLDNTSLMLIPQTGTAWNKDNATDGTYILLLCRVEAKHKGAEHDGGNSGDVVVDKENNTHTHQLFPVTTTYDEEEYGYTCVAIQPEWKHGKKYVYNLEFCGANSGAGVYPPKDIENIEGLPKGDNIITDIPEGKDVGDPVLDNPITFTVTVDGWTSEGSDGEDKDTPMN